MTEAKLPDAREYWIRGNAFDRDGEKYVPIRPRPDVYVWVRADQAERCARRAVWFAKVKGAVPMELRISYGTPPRVLYYPWEIVENEWGAKVPHPHLDDIDKDPILMALEYQDTTYYCSLLDDYIPAESAVWSEYFNSYVPHPSIWNAADHGHDAIWSDLEEDYISTEDAYRSDGLRDHWLIYDGEYSDDLRWRAADAERTFGIELEFDYVELVDLQAEAISAFEGHPVAESFVENGFAIVKPDSSTKDGAEIAFQPLTKDQFVKLKGNFERLIDACGGFPSGGAGTHIHVSAKDVTEESLGVIVSVLAGAGGWRLADLIFEKPEDQLDTWSALPTPTVSRTLTSDCPIERKKEAVPRYSAVNIARWPETIEFRCFGQATHIDNLITWVEFVDAVVEYSKSKVEAHKASAWDFVKFVREHARWPELAAAVESF